MVSEMSIVLFFGVALTMIFVGAYLYITGASMEEDSW